MAKKKKKQPKPAVKKQPHLMSAPNPDGTFPIQWLMALSSLNTVGIKENFSAMYPDKIDDDCIMRTTSELYCKQQINKNSSIDDIRNGMTKDIAVIHEIFGKYLSDFSDMNQSLNKYVCKDKFDSIDLRQYVREKDIFEEAFRIINECPDVTMLFSPSETFDIQVTDSISYRVTRCVYDHVNCGVRYCFVEYKKVLLEPGIAIEIPTCEAVFQADVVHITDRLNVKNENAQKPVATYDTIYSAHIIDSIYKNTYENVLNMVDPDDFYAIRLGRMGIKSLLQQIRWTKNNLSLSKTDRRGTYEMLLIAYNNQYGVCFDENSKKSSFELDFALKMHNHIAQTLPIAAVIVTNYYLKQNKLSKPVNSEAQKIIHKSEIILENRPERKTRMLGDSIRITTEKRPQAITEEKLIKYHTPEWQRRSHLRRLKSGKVVEVKAQTVRRRCVDMSNVINKQSQPATDYVIRPENSPEENNTQN